jgi:hypothetical protein
MKFKFWYLYIKFIGIQVSSFFMNIYDGFNAKMAEFS